MKEPLDSVTEFHRIYRVPMSDVPVATPSPELVALRHRLMAEENEEYLDLDRKRVAIAVKYFVAQGIAEERIIKTYKGTSTPSAEIVEDDEQDVKDAKCRRVEFRVKM